MASMAAALGYMWEDIERLYSVQLSMLEKLHGMTRGELKQKIETMYNGYRFSPDSNEAVFNLWAINRFIETGKFVAHFTRSGLSKSLVTGSFPQSKLALMRLPGYAEQCHVQEIEEWRYAPELESQELSVIVRLIGAGVLTFASIDGVTFLKVPNDDARHALDTVLIGFARGFSCADFSNLVLTGDICGMAKLLRTELKQVAVQAAFNAAGADNVLEYHLQHAFLPCRMLFSGSSRSRTGQSGQKFALKKGATRLVLIS